MAQQLLKTILITSLSGSCLALVITLLKPITKKFFGYRWHYYIWLAVLVVMILPIRLTVLDKETASTPIVHTITMQTVTNNEITTPGDIEAQPALPAVTTPQTPIKNGARILTNLIDNGLNILSSIWLLGVLVMLSVSAIGYLRLIHKIHKKSVIISCPEIQNYTTRRVTVRTCKDLASPFVMGILRPSLVLPNIILSAEQLDNILMHEMTHLKRNDILYKWFMSVVKALHWFNPIVYHITNQINTECEISCDLSVVRNMNDTQTENYVNTIISLLSAGRTKNIPLTTGMTGNKNTLKKRFIMIKNRFFVNKKAMIISVVSAVLIFTLAISISGFLNGKWINFYGNSIIELNTDKRSGDTFNALIIGVDEQNRADSIMLLKFTDTSIDGVSIPRNTVFNKNTISQILTQENGDQMVIDTIRNELSLPITYYAKIKIDLIRDLVDSAGGLTFDVPMDMKYDDPHKNLHIDLKKGDSQHLSGEQVCGLLQFRRSNDGTGYTQGDLDRIKIGHRIITSFISQNNLKKLVINSKDIVDSINNNVVTNYPIKNFVKDRKLLSDKKITFSIIPGNTAVNNGVFEYKIDLAIFNGVSNSPIKSDNPPQVITNNEEHQANVVSYENTPLTQLDLQTAQTQNNARPTTELIENTSLEKVEAPNIPSLDVGSRLDFSSIAEAEQYLQSGGAVAANSTEFKSGSNYIINNYSYENNCKERILDIASNNDGEISIYFNANLDTLMNVRFKDSETDDEINSAIVLTGNERIYKFTGFDPLKHYDIELSALTEGEWEIEGQYIIF